MLDGINQLKDFFQIFFLLQQIIGYPHNESTTLNGLYLVTNQAVIDFILN